MARRNHRSRSQQYTSDAQRPGDYGGRSQTNRIVLNTPYNFIPLAKKVVRPSWAQKITHDKPFGDAQSGRLKLIITAKQPIFTQNSISRTVTNQDKRKEMGSHFSVHDNRYFLPGTSVKGAIRNVLEAMSFGDLAKRLNEEIWALRDLTLQSYKDLFSWDSNVHCGWLYKSGNSYKIEDCGLPHRITHEQIDAHFGKPILANWVRQFKKYPEKNERHLKYSLAKGLASQKRALFSNRALRDTFTDIDGKKIIGDLVFTGQPSIGYDDDGWGTIQVKRGTSIKYKEFIFAQVQETIGLSGEVVAAFEFAHERLDLKKNERVPVFFHKNEESKVTSFGLAYMYKIPFTYTVKDAIERYQKESGKGPDMAECIFGYVEKSNALRGRVAFGHAFAEGQPQELAVKSEVLNSPKATYYPTYIRQNVKPSGKIKGDTYQTLFDEGTVPSGWKRYPVHCGDVKCNPGPKNKYGEENKKIQTQFRALPAETVFTCVVLYHNLNKIELGALLSALTFHNTDGCYHTFGMAKPLGYGKCSIKVEGLDDVTMKECMVAYERYMESELKENGGWLQSDQMRELLAMSRDQQNTGRSELKYVPDPKRPDVQYFAKVKKAQLALDCYTRLGSIMSVTPASLSDSSAPSGGADGTKLAQNPHDIFEQRKRELMQKIKAQKQILSAPRLAELSIGSIVAAQVTAVSGNNIDVRLLVNSPEPEMAKIAPNSIKKAEQAAGRTITFKVGMTVSVRLTEKASPGGPGKVAFVHIQP